MRGGETAVTNGRCTAALATYSVALAETDVSYVLITAPERRIAMPDFNRFDMDFDGDVDGIDFLGFDYLIRHVLQPEDEEERDDAKWYTSRATDGWDDEETGSY
jgi:hypothetical protein